MFGMSRMIFFALSDDYGSDKLTFLILHAS